MNGKLRFMRFILGLLITGLHFLLPAMAQVDLHSHLYMKHGLGPVLQGSAKSEARAQSAASRLDTKASEVTLLSQGSPRITVVSLYAHPWLSSPLSLRLRDNVTAALEEEYRELEEFVNSRKDRVVLARKPDEARQALAAGKQVLVLSIEGAYGALETEADLVKWVDERGLAIAGPFHLTEDYFGGTALMSPLLSLVTSPLTFLQSVVASKGSCLNSYCTSNAGLKPAGRDLVARLVERKVWVDLSHANELERSELLPEFKKRNLPLLITHTPLESHFPSERSLSPMEMDYLKNTGGLVGLIPSDDYLDGVRTAGCFSGLVEYKKQIQALEAKIGKNRVMIGSDSNAPLKGLSRACAIHEGEILGTFESTGFYRQDQFKTLSDYISTEPEWTAAGEEAFLSNWEKIKSR
jgi:microsomal dipeptidase-like Zn-dependent dipeptidase